MNSKRILIPVLVLLAVLLLMGGCSRHYVDVYINEECAPVTLDNDPDRAIDPLWVFPGDYVIFNNMRETHKVKLVFPPGLFEEGEVEIEAGSRVILKVVADGPMEGTIGISGSGCPSGDPKVKVGDGP